MTTERHARIKELFLAACQRPAGERSAFLSRECGGDADLLSEVESLLEFHRVAGTDIGGVQPPLAGLGAEDAPERVGNYRLLRRIGEGGMGVVFEAEQERPVRRLVALKLIKLGMQTREVIARFESERQALAMMSHPNVATVLDAGTTESGRPYFAMELVAGEPITRYCDDHGLSVRERVALFVQVCHGVHHAHQKGIIHRDLKPSNILVPGGETAPTPKVIDFGVAKAVGGRLGGPVPETLLGQWIGTPAYMSPEQAEAGRADVDTRTDVYSLGIVLYELLVGVVPFEAGGGSAASFDEMRRRVREDDPARPSTRAVSLTSQSESAARRSTDARGLGRALRGDLDWIVLRAIEKDRTRRYGSPAELAADLERFLRYEPVLAGPPGPVYRSAKFVRRHAVAVTAAGLVGLALVLGTVAATVGLMRAEREAAAANEAAELLIGVFREVDPSLPAQRAASVQRILDIGAERIESSLSGRPRLQARLMFTIGNVYRTLGDYDDAKPLLEHALALQRANLASREDRAAMAGTLGSLGWLHALTADFSSAARYFDEAVAAAEDAVGADQPQTLAYISHSGWLACRVGNFDAAGEMLDRAYAGAAALADPDPLLVSDILFNRGVLRRALRQYDEALADFLRSAALREQFAGADNYRLGWAFFDLGLTCHWMGRLGEARTYYERSLRILEGSLGRHHMAVAYPVNHLGALDLDEGDLDSARERLERALEIRTEALGPGHPDVAWSLVQLGRLEAACGHHETARQLFRRTLEIQERVFGPDHPEVIATLYVSARQAQDAGRFSQGMALATRLEEVLRRPPARPRQILSRELYWLACLAARGGDRERALKLFREAVDTGFVDATVLGDPDLESLAGDPEYEALVEEVRLRLAR